MSVAEKVVGVVSSGLSSRSSRRGFLFRSTLVGSALALNPWRFLLRPGHRVRGVVRTGRELLVGLDRLLLLDQRGQQLVSPRKHPGRLVEDRPVGLLRRRRALHHRLQRDLRHRAAAAAAASARRVVTTAAAIAAPDRATSACVCCNQFRYGQCHQELACVGPVVCRVASCRPPWEVDPTCTTASATANETALHTAPCLDDNARCS